MGVKEINSLHPAPSTQHPAPSTQHPAPSTQHLSVLGRIYTSSEDFFGTIWKSGSDVLMFDLRTVGGKTALTTALPGAAWCCLVCCWAETFSGVGAHAGRGTCRYMRRSVEAATRQIVHRPKGNQIRTRAKCPNGSYSLTHDTRTLTSLTHNMPSPLIPSSLCLHAHTHAYTYCIRTQRARTATRKRTDAHNIRQACLHTRARSRPHKQQVAQTQNLRL